MGFRGGGLRVRGLGSFGLHFGFDPVCMAFNDKVSSLIMSSAMTFSPQVGFFMQSKTYQRRIAEVVSTPGRTRTFK